MRAMLVRAKNRAAAEAQPPSPPVAPRPCYIEALNDDLMDIIFSFLSAHDRLLASRVCERWRTVAQSTLTYLEFSWCWQRVTDATLQPLLEQCYSLQEADLRHCALTDRTLRCLAANCKDLTSLALGGRRAPKEAIPEYILTDSSWEHLCAGNRAITDAGIVTLAASLGSLKHVVITYCTSLTDVGLSVLGATCPFLQSLDIQGCRYVSDMGVRLVSLGCPEVTTLNLGACVRVTDGAVRWVASCLRELRRLGLAYCLQVTEAGVQALCGHPTLEALDLTGLHGIPGDAVLALTSSLLPRPCKLTLPEASGGAPATAEASAASAAAAAATLALDSPELEVEMDATDASFLL
eukprot:tig00020660_g12536.t1